jgi:hypothetical protein
MKIQTICILAIVFFSFRGLEASEYKCTEWKAQRSTTCIFAGSRASVYKRQCENACWYNSRTRQGNMGAECDQEKVCHPSNPANFGDVCSEWIKVGGITCYDPNTESWEQKWQRACTIGIKEHWCSRANPNNL